jgi:hypothetical protein
VKFRGLLTGLILSIGALALLGPAAAHEQVTLQSRLSLMPLRAVSLGPEARNLPLDHDSGVQTNSESAKEANSNFTSKDVAKVGQITAYQLDYRDRGLGALQAGRGLFNVGTEVRLFRSVTDAKRGLAFWSKDELNVKPATEVGVSIKVTQFPTPGLGDAGHGFQGTTRLSGKAPYYWIDVWFRSGRILASVSVSAADRGRALPLALDLAQKLQTRIEGVVAGTVTASPVRIPHKPGAGPPLGGPSPQAMTLTNTDLGSGRVTHQSYLVDNYFEPVSEYARAFTGVGQYADLEEIVLLFHSATEASYNVAYLGGAFSSSKYLNDAASTGSGKGQKLSFTVRRINGINAGDELRVSRATVSVPGGHPIGRAYLVMRVGRTFEVIIVTTPVGAQLVPSALAELARSAAERVHKGLR